MTRLFLRSIVLMNISLFGGLCFAAAPVASVDVNSGTVQIQQPANSQNTSNTAPATPPASATQQSVASTNTTPPATTPVAKPAPPTIDSAALLASLTPEQRIARLENQVQYLSGYNTQLQNLSTEVDVLRGQVEDLNHQVYLLKKKAEQQNNPMTPASTAASTTANSSTGNEPQTNQNAPTKPSQTTTASTDTNTNPNNATVKKAPQTPPPPAAEQTAFNKAYTLLVKQNYMEATTAFTDFLNKYPKSSLASDAHYWLGDLYLAQGQPDNASQQYRAVVNVKDADKRPDAMAKLGTILLAYGDSAHAKQLFQQVVQEYPNSSAAKQAQTRLKSL